MLVAPLNSQFENRIKITKRSKIWQGFDYYALFFTSATELDDINAFKQKDSNEWLIGGT